MRPTVKLYRLKLDLTKYIEEHHFVFDRVFDEATTNEGVSEDIANYSIVVPRGSPTAGICGLSGDKGHLLRIWPNGQWQNLHDDRPTQRGNWSHPRSWPISPCEQRYLRPPGKGSFTSLLLIDSN